MDFKNPAHLGMVFTVMAVVTTNLWIYRPMEWIFIVPTALSWFGTFYCAWWVIQKKKRP